ncbi:hypothetical protein GUITHDRAFT_133292 [Guillardia theta CCMP2712]|uniref:Uncharacterized protein n=2 Tax=Guillardia theta TaxID=55529 RepID=L1JXR1_GUITC|nr:hypothetical protein GUITHDRAFT_133292 [Guillardia theta CCMP2712]EKX52873.1 hypothetical protein GUITHDRAFT_133292 [Guillardia theta CCMP2712]|eukprot:XP_005839853.1 hypothetical protein GUITHDRAFT_133292 [Guillardia theta CCMP2712]
MLYDQVSSSWIMWDELGAQGLYPSDPTDPHLSAYASQQYLLASRPPNNPSANPVPPYMSGYYDQMARGVSGPSMGTSVSSMYPSGSYAMNGLGETDRRLLQQHQGGMFTSSGMSGMSSAPMSSGYGQAYAGYIAVNHSQAPHEAPGMRPSQQTAQGTASSIKVRGGLMAASSADTSMSRGFVQGSTGREAGAAYLMPNNPAASSYANRIQTPQSTQPSMTGRVSSIANPNVSTTKNPTAPSKQSDRAIQGNFPPETLQQNAPAMGRFVDCFQEGFIQPGVTPTSHGYKNSQVSQDIASQKRAKYSSMLSAAPQMYHAPSDQPLTSFQSNGEGTVQPTFQGRECYDQTRDRSYSQVPISIAAGPKGFPEISSDLATYPGTSNTQPRRNLQQMEVYSNDAINSAIPSHQSDPSKKNKKRKVISIEAQAGQMVGSSTTQQSLAGPKVDVRMGASAPVAARAGHLNSAPMDMPAENQKMHLSLAETSRQGVKSQGMTPSHASKSSKIGKTGAMSAESMLSASVQMERSGAIAYAIMFLEGGKLYSTLSPMEGVKIRLRLTDLYSFYTFNHESAISRMHEALRLLERTGGSSKSHAICVVLHLRLACVHARIGKSMDKAWRELTAAKKIVEDIKILEYRPWIHLVSYQLHASTGDFEPAHAEIRSCMELLKDAILPRRSEFEIVCYMLLAHSKLQAGMVQEAREHVSSVDAILEGSKGKQELPAELRPFFETLRLLTTPSSHVESLQNSSKNLSVPRHSHLQFFWWHSDSSLDVLLNFFRSQMLPAIHIHEVLQSSDSTASTDKKDALLKAEEVLKDGFEMMEHSRKVDEMAASPPMVLENALLNILLLERSSALCLCRSSYNGAVEKLSAMIDALKLVENMASFLASDSQKQLLIISIHCSIANYLVRMGEMSSALAHLREAELLSSRSPTTVSILLLEALVLLDGSDVLPNQGNQEMLEETVAREGEKFVSKAEKLLSDQSCLSWARATILFLKAKHMLKGSTSLDQESIEGAIDLLQKASECVVEDNSDFQLQIKILALRGDALLMLDQATAALASLTDAHTRVNMVGDVWLELRILRGLERCYLKLPDRFHVAKASLTVKANRERRINEAIAAARSSPHHIVVKDWRIPGSFK